MTQPRKILHVITGLGRGGAEMMLLKLIQNMPQDRFTHAVVSLTDIAGLKPEFQALGVPLHSLSLPPGRISAAGLRQFLHILRGERPALVQGWMYHGNILATVATLLAREKLPVYWSIHFTLGGLVQEKPLTKFLIKLGRFLAFQPRKIHYVSKLSATNHEALGYPEKKRVLIPIGFDAAAFKPDPAAYAALRQDLGVAPSSRLVGLVARNHPMKDPLNFIAAAAGLKSVADLFFVMAGNQLDPQNAALTGAIAAAGLEKRVFLLGERRDVAQLMAAFDVFCLASAYGEAFPNVIGEAMACGVPCVATDLGDCRDLIADTGRLVPPRHPELLAQALKETLAAQSELGEKARQRIVSVYAVAKMAAAFTAFYEP